MTDSTTEKGGFRTIGEIAALHHVHGGTVLTMFSASEGYILIPVHEESLTDAGIPLEPGIQFSAEVNGDAADVNDLCPRGFEAIEQLEAK